MSRETISARGSSVSGPTNHPLSPSQERFWLLDQLDPDHAGNKVSLALRMRGSLNLSALHCSLNEIVGRHEILRTTFDRIDGELRQIVHPPMGLELPTEHLGGFSPEDREVELLTRLRLSTRQRFDLVKGPLIHARLLRLANEDHVLLLAVHHTVFDGVSSDVMWRELLALYPKFCRGDTSELPPLELQYHDYAAWQRRRIAEGDLRRQLAYWEERLGDGPPRLALPTDRPRTRAEKRTGDTVELMLSGSRLQKLLALRAEEDTSFTNLLLAAFTVLLHRCTGQSDICMGIATGGRSSPDLNSLLGVFINTVILRADLSDDPTFRTFLKRFREVTSGAYRHSEIPFEKVLAQMQAKRGNLQGTFPEVLCSIVDVSRVDLDMPQLEVGRIDIPPQDPHFELTFYVYKHPQTTRVILLYDTALFDRPTIERMAQHYVNLLEAVVADPDAVVSRLPVLGPAERDEVLELGRGEVRDFPDGSCIHDLLEAQVDRAPEAVAVVEGETRLTYGELNARANRLARHLRGLGVVPETLVGIFMERSVDLVVAVLGVLKAGGAYVPMDTSHPPRRLQAVLEDAAPPVLLTQSKLLARLPEHSGKAVCLDLDREEIERHEVGNLAAAATADNLAYVMYTSGSTGTPKGALICHRSLCNFVTWAQRIFPLDETDRVPFKTPFTFDASVWELYAPLVAGAQQILAPPEVPWDLDELVATIRRHEVTIVKLVPSLLRLLLDHPGFANCGFLRRVLCGGEALPTELAASLRERSDAVLYNVYGPTEATVDASWYTCDPDDEQTIQPIGQAVDNVRLYLLDSNLEPVPRGTPAELYIGGVGVARGYLNRPELTAECFVPDPFVTDPDARLYKTGDLARFRQDGELEFLGRLDHQVKIHGQRIELGEIELALNAHPGIRQSVVAGHAAESDRSRLVAYFVRADGGETTSEELKAFLRESLPEPMVPSVFVVLDELPMTRHGKIDRKALPEPQQSAGDAKTYVAPHGKVEVALAGIWADLLGFDRVGTHDNFFELGGDSIVSIQVVSRAREAGIGLTPRMMFQYHTIAELATACSRCEPSETEIEAGSPTDPVPLTPIQRRFFELQLPEPHHYNQTMMLEITRQVPVEVWEQALARLVDHHDALRTRFVKEGAVWRQITASNDEPLPFVVVDLADLPPNDRAEAMERRSAELHTSLHISEGPLLRVALFRLGAQRPDRLLIAIHHLVVDGVSWRILLEDLERCCEALLRGETPRLPPKTWSFARWAHRLGQAVETRSVGADRDYWCGIAWSGIEDLPLDHERGPNTVGTSETIRVDLSREETRALLQEVPETYNTRIDDVLLAALLRAFSAWTGRSALLLDLEGHGREDLVEGADVSRTVGWFTSFYPVLLRLDGVSGPDGLLKSVKEQLRPVPHRGIGYGLLRYLGPDVRVAEQLAALPRAQVRFNYLGQFDQVLGRGSLFSRSRESIGLTSEPRNGRQHLIDIVASVVDGRLEIRWTYGLGFHRRDTIERIVRDFVSALRELIEHCRSPETGGYTPSDFPLSGLDQRGLDALVDQFAERDRIPASSSSERRPSRREDGE